MEWLSIEYAITGRAKRLGILTGCPELIVIIISST